MKAESTHDAILDVLIPAAERPEFDQRVKALVFLNGARETRELATLDARDPEQGQRAIERAVGLERPRLREDGLEL
jgi:hypothetical protein